MTSPRYTKHLGSKTAAQIATLPVEFLRGGNTVLDTDTSLMNYYDGAAWVPYPAGP